MKAYRMSARLLCSLLALLALSMPAVAHNVLGGVYAIGSEIEGEAGFSNGDMAQSGLTVEILDNQGRLLGTTETEEDGFFRFQATRRVDHHFRIDMGTGHLLEVSLPAEELPASLAGGNPDEAGESVVASERAVSADERVLQTMIETAVARQIAPLRKELNAYKEKSGLRDVLGGVGYIFGICGLVMMLRSRKQHEQAD